MFGFFNKKKKESENEFIITTRITKTSSQAQYENEIWEAIKLQADTCPNCKTINKNYGGIPLWDSYNKIYVIHSECTKCNTEWETRFKKYCDD